MISALSDRRAVRLLVRAHNKRRMIMKKEPVDMKTTGCCAFDCVIDETAGRL